MKNLIFVVTHKKFNNTDLKEPYEVISVGSNEKKLGFKLMDCIGEDNIAEKNPYYCELTAQYWIWKNYSEKFDNIGLSHYRRYFANSLICRFKKISDKKVTKYLNKYDVILPYKWHWKVSVAEYYDLAEGKMKDLVTTEKAILQLYPEYIESFKQVLNSNEASYCNMFIMRKNEFCQYSEWLFNILRYVELHTDLTEYTKSEARIYGYISEILLNVWVQYNKLNIKYLPMIESENSVIEQIKKDIRTVLKKNK